MTTIADFSAIEDLSAIVDLTQIADLSNFLENTQIGISRERDRHRSIVWRIEIN